MAHPADVLRLFALLAVPAALALFDALSALVMLLVAGGCWALRYYAASRWQDLAGQLVLLLAGAFSVLGSYRVFAGLDLATHFAVLWVLTALVHDALRCHGLWPSPATSGQAAGQAISMTGLGALLAVLWEIGEFIGHRLINPLVGVGYTDTVFDLLAGVLGATAAACWTLFRRRPRRRR